MSCPRCGGVTYTENDTRHRTYRACLHCGWHYEIGGETTPRGQNRPQDYVIVGEYTCADCGVRRRMSKKLERFRRQAGSTRCQPCAARHARRERTRERAITA